MFLGIESGLGIATVCQLMYYVHINSIDNAS